MHGTLKTARPQLNGAMIFNSAGEMLDALLPQQYDAHVREFRIERGEIELTPWQRSVREARAAKRVAR